MATRPASSKVAKSPYNLIADRLTPYSSQATVQAYIVSVAPEVVGKVAEIGVVDNQIVKEGDLLFRLDQTPSPQRLLSGPSATPRPR